MENETELKDEKKKKKTQLEEVDDVFEGIMDDLDKAVSFEFEG